MAVLIVRATYMEQNALEIFLTSLFGQGQSEVTWKRGRYQCTVPRRLTADEILKLKEVVPIEHYDQS